MFQTWPNIICLLNCGVIHFTCKSFTKLITKISLLELPYTPFWYSFLYFLRFLHHKQVVCAGLHTLHLGWLSHHALIWYSAVWPRCNQSNFDFNQIEMLPDDSLFSWKVDLKQLGCEWQQIQEFSHPSDYIFQIHYHHELLHIHLHSFQSNHWNPHKQIRSHKH